MSKKLFKRYLPDPKKIKEEKSLQIFGKLLHDPFLWHLNRHSVSTAFSVGMFAALIPVPFQMLMAAAFAILFRANLPIAVGLTWITNPLTTPPIVYFSYRLGAFLLDVPPEEFKIEFTFEWLMHEFSRIGWPFVLGTLVVAISASALSNIIIRLMWRTMIVRAWQTRHSERAKARQSKRRKKKRKKQSSHDDIV